MDNPYKMLPASRQTLHALLILLAFLCTGASGQNQFLYHVPEGQPAGVAVGNITRDARLHEMYSPEELNDINFRLSNQRDPLSQEFQINHRTGVITTRSVLDRDTACPMDDMCIVTLNVVTSPAELSNFYRVTIYIHDRNDNAPIFESNEKFISMPENTEIGTEYVLPSAEDIDSLPFSVRSYELIPSSSQFALRVFNTSDGFLEVRLKIIQPLDRELQQFYEFRLIAYDSGTPRHSGSMVLSITITDYNDNVPEFENEEYDVMIPENTPVDSSIVRVHALDEDETAEITYSLSQQTEESFGSIFGIRSDSGDIYVRAVLDRETTPSYVLTVQVSDGGTNPSYAFCRVVITLRDVNDNPPYIQISALGGGGEEAVSVPEEARAGSAVAHISASDPDEGNGGMVSCSMRSTPYFVLEELGENTEYTLKTLVSMNREAQEEYEVIIDCADRGDPGRRTTRHVTVLVEDINDHVPEFWSESYDVTISERNPVGRYLIQINATDHDANGNGAIKFRFDNVDSEQYLELNPITGVIRANVEFDYETNPLMEFVIIAYDQGEVSESSTATLTLTVQDINDEVPQFVEDGYQFYVFEEQPPHATIGTVHALDADSPPFNDISYSIDYTGDDFNSFAINEETGEIYTTRRLDREEQSLFIVTVRAVNPGYARMQSATNVTIEVADRNDNTPIISFPKADNNTVYISKDLPVGSIVTSIQASDRDGGISGELTFLAVDNGTFLVNSSTGDVLVQRNLSLVQKSFFDLMVNVTDHGSPPRYAVTHLYIKVESALIGEVSSDDGAFVSFLRDNLLFLIIGIVLVVLFFTLCCVILAVFLRNRRHKQKQKQKYNGGAIVLANKEPIKDYQQHQKEDDQDLDLQKKKALEALNESSLQRKGVKFSTDLGETSTDDPLWNTALDMAILENSAHRLALEHGVHQNGRIPSGTATELQASTWDPSTKRPTDDHLSDSSVSTTGYTGSAPNRARAPPNNYVHLDGSNGTGGGGSAPSAGGGGTVVGKPQQTWPLSESYQPVRSYQSMNRSSPLTPLTEMELEVHEMLEILRQEQDSENDSYTDSGRGPSEEGDGHNRHSPLDGHERQDERYARPRALDGDGFDQRSRTAQSRGPNKTKRKLLYPGHPSPMHSMSTGGSSDMDSSFNMSSTEQLAYSPEALYQRLRSQVAPSSNVLLGDKLVDTTSTDAGKIHMNDSVGCAPISPRLNDQRVQAISGEDIYGIPHKGRTKPKVPVRTSSFNAMNDAKAAGIAASVSSTPPLKVHDHPPSGYRAVPPIPNTKSTFGSPELSAHNVPRMALLPNTRTTGNTNSLNSQPQNTSVSHNNRTSNEPTRPRFNLTPLSRAALEQRSSQDHGSDRSPTSISEDDNTTTSGSYIIDGWDVPKVTRPPAPVGVTSPGNTAIQHPSAIQQALV